MHEPAAERADPTAIAAGFVALCADADAFARWYRRALPRVYGYVRAQAGGNIDLAEDITQHAFVQAIRAQASFDGRADPVTWICSIARNALLNHYRSERREWRRRVAVVPEIEMPDSPTATADRDDLVRALGLLHPDQRAALILKYVDQMSLREIARTIGRSEAAAESLLSRARVRLRDALEGRS
jgi:RNA polymerase sigma-70 factor (ECF subfamily)